MDQKTAIKDLLACDILTFWKDFSSHEEGKHALLLKEWELVISVIIELLNKQASGSHINNLKDDSNGNTSKYYIIVLINITTPWYI